MLLRTALGSLCLVSFSLLAGCAKPPTIGEFESSVIGMTAEELLEYAGKPQQIKKDAFEKRERWEYLYKVKDPSIDKMLPKVEVVFADGKVTKVEY